MPFQIIRNDITKVKADAIVNTANPQVAIGGGVDSAIYKAAGRDKLLAARAEIGPLAPGEVGVTPAFDLDAKYIIHVSGPRWKDGRKGEESLLRACYEKALLAAAERDCRSIAFPLLATGTYGFPKELGIQIAVDSFTAFLEEHEMEITLAVFGDEAFQISGELVEEVADFLDPRYVKRALREEYAEPVFGEPVKRNVSGTFRASKAVPVGRPLGDFEEEGAADVSFKKSDYLRPGAEPEDLEEMLKGIYTESFGKHLRKLINKKGLKNSQVYAAANISKQYFSKLLKDEVNPSKAKVLALAVGLRLNLDETVDLLRLAGYALSPISQTDAVVKYFIARGDYSVIKIDIVLFDFGLDPLSKG